MSNFIDPSISTGSTNFANLTNYFDKMSLGLYHAIGEAVYVETPVVNGVPHTQAWYSQNGYGRAETNADVLQNAVNPIVNFALYDNWRYDSTYHHTNQADGTVDMIVMVWRGNPWGLGEASLGYGSNITVDGKTIKFGYGGNSGSGVTCSYPYSHWPEKLLQTMSHEIGHWLVGGNHPYDPYAPVFSVWGILGPQYVCGVCMNSYERERVGWINCTPVTEVNAPMADYITSGVSYKYHPSNGSANEYIYFENHQKISIYDDASTNPNDKGIYALQQEGLYGDWNNMRILPQDGRWNWQNPYYNTSCFTGFSVPAFKKISVQRDETGYSYRDAIPTIGGIKDWMLTYINQSGSEICGGFMRGDSPFLGAFNTSVNTILSTWSNPNTNTWYNNSTSLGMEVLSQNGSTITAHFYLTNPILAAPSKPQNVSVGVYGRTRFNPGVAQVSWIANAESDIVGYEIYRSVGSPNTPTLLATVGTSQTNYIDYGATIGTGMMVYYKVKAKDTQGLSSTYSDAASIESSSWQQRIGRQPETVLAPPVPDQFELAQNYPNPFNPSTRISYALLEAGIVHLTVFDYLGRDVATLVNEYKEAGYYEARFDASRFPSGIYFYRFQSGNFRTVMKMVLIK
jgi:M6 family metalloprotease-like protein